MELLLIRHGEKLYANNKNPKGYPAHDSPLIYHPPSLIESKVQEFLEKSGPPSYILTSPFQRTRDTSRLICDQLKKLTQLEIPIQIDVRLSEFLGWQKGVAPELEIETQKYQVFPLGESLESLRERCQRFLDSQRSKGQVVWVITHGLVIRNLVEIYSGKKLDSRWECPSLGSFHLKIGSEISDSIR